MNPATPLAVVWLIGIVPAVCDAEAGELDEAMLDRLVTPQEDNRAAPCE